MAISAGITAIILVFMTGLSLTVRARALRLQREESERRRKLEQELGVVRLELEGRTRERTLFFDILRETVSAKDLDSLLQELAKRLGDELALREFAILLREKKGERFVIRSLYGLEDPNHTLRGRAIKLGEGLSGEAAQQRQAIVVNDVSAEPDYLAFWNRVSREGAFASFPILHAGDLVGLLAMTRPLDHPFSDAEQQLMQAVADQLASAIRQVELIDELRELSNHDDLTGLANRRLFRTRLDIELAHVRRFGHALSILLVDIDHFKMLNDRHGHAVGDGALSVLAMLMQKALRQVDTVARIGGEEFAIILPHTDAIQARRVAETLRSQIAGGSIPGSTEQPGGHLTVSVGVTEYVRGDEAEDLLKRADLALYRAKKEGRNRVEDEPGLRNRKDSGFHSRTPESGSTASGTNRG